MRRRKVIISACLGFAAALIVVALWQSLRGGAGTNILTTFEGYTNSPKQRLALFQITNSSGVYVRLFDCSIGGNQVEFEALEFEAGESKPVTVSVPDPLPPGAVVQFTFWRRDTSFEEGREMLDSVLRSIRIRVPGLNPDSKLNLIHLSCELPAEDQFTGGLHRP